MSDSADTAILTQALDRFSLAADAEKAQRDRETAALRFQVPELQWPDDAKQQRQGGMIGGVPLPARPMLSIPKLDQPIQLELNKEKNAHLGVQIHPVSEEADDDTAEMLQNHYRQIEIDSRAGLARSWAYERGVKCGRGAYRLLTEYDPAAPKGSKDQRILIKRILHQESVYLDPFSQEPNFSDAQWGFITQWIPWSRYKAQYGTKAGKTPDEADLATYDDRFLNVLSEQQPNWIKGDGESRAVLVAEYFTIEYDEDQTPSVQWRKINAVQTLETRKLPGTALPIFVYVGRELIPFDADRRFVGIIEPNMDGQRFFNYSASIAAETMGAEPKATWVLAEGQEEGHEQEFLQANVRNFPYLRYKPTTVNGELAPPPTRVQADTSKLGLSMQALSMASEFVHAGTFAFEPSLGQNSPNVKTKGATLALQSQSDQANSHWLQSLVDTMEHEAAVVIDWICYYYDRPGRIIRTRDGEDNQDRVMVNQPYVQQQGQLTPVEHGQLPPGATPADVKHYNLKNGARYGVSVSIGKAYKSRVEQGADMLGQLMQAEPGLLKVAGDIYFRFADFPGHQELSDRFKKMLPPELQDQNGQQDPQMELQQAKAAMQQMQQQMQEMGEALKTDKVKVDGQIQQEQIRASMQLTLQKMKDATTIAAAQIQVLAKGVQMQTEARNEAQAVGDQQLVDAHTAAMDRQHEINAVMLKHQQAMDAAQQAHEHAMAQGQAGAQQDAALADQGHQQALEQGDAQAANTMAAQQQAADLAPQPEAGA